MRITMIAFGTRGDVQPAVALGKALKSEGHRVRILAGANFKDWISRHGLEAFASKIDIESVMESDLGRDWIEKGANPINQMRVIKKLTDQTGWQSMTEAWAACRDADVIFSSFTSDIYALSIAEKLGVAHISMPLQPALLPTRSGAATMNAPLPNHKSIFNYIFGRLFLEPFNWRLSGKMVNRFRREVLSLSPQLALIILPRNGGYLRFRHTVVTSCLRQRTGHRRFARLATGFLTNRLTGSLRVISSSFSTQASRRSA